MASNCADVFNGFREMTEHLSPEIYRKASMSNPWLTAIPRGVFPEGTGLNQDSAVIANSEPTNDVPAWQAEADINADTNTEGHCALTYSEVDWGVNVRHYTPEKSALKGPLVCRDELTFDFMVDQYLGSYIEEITKNAARYQTNRLREQYISYSNKAIATSGFPITAGVSLSATAGSATLPSTQATSELTYEMLNAVAMQLIYAGATDPDSNGYISLGPDGPLFTLLIHPEMSNKLIRDNPDVRNDIRYADMGMGDQSDLLKRLGATRRFYNFQLLPDVIPPRYEYTGGQYVRVNTFTTSAATGKGQQSVVSTAYQNATYEAAIVLHPKAITVEFVKPKNGAASANFNPANYMGDWTWVTGGYRLGLDPVTCPDPTEKYGRHFSEIRWGIKPIFPEYAYTIIYKRCQTPIGTITCS